MTETRGDNDRGGDSLLARARHNGWNGRRWRRDNDQVRRLRQILDPGDATQAVDLPVLGIDEINRRGKPRCAHVAQYCAPERPLAWARADERDRAGREELFELVGGHALIRGGALISGVLQLALTCAVRAALATIMEAQEVPRQRNPIAHIPLDFTGTGSIRCGSRKGALRP